MKIRNVEVPVDIQAELEPHLNHFRNYRIRGDKLQACSPFRYENHPSFAVNLENGTWIDSGASTDSYHKGNFISLLAYLRQEEYLDTEEYLLRAYNVMLEEVERLQLKIDLQQESTVGVTYDWFKDFPQLQFRHPYLTRRGITKEVQKLFCIGFDKEQQAVSLPWFNNDKKVINVKFRSILYKQYFYLQDGQLTRNYVYGLPQAISKGYKAVTIVESEIDAMSLWTIGIAGVATGHAGINARQIQLLINAGIEEVTIMTDADEAGWRFESILEKELPKHFITYNTDIFKYGVKDVNDLLLLGKLEECYNNRKFVEVFRWKNGKI